VKCHFREKDSGAPTGVSARGERTRGTHRPLSLQVRREIIVEVAAQRRKPRYVPSLFGLIGWWVSRSRRRRTDRSTRFYRLDEEFRSSLPHGGSTNGQLSYDRTGHMSAQLIFAIRSISPAGIIVRAITKQGASAWTGYFGYFGTGKIDE